MLGGEFMHAVTKLEVGQDSMAEVGIVQISARGSIALRNEVKIMAIKKGVTVNDLLLKYIEEGLKRDKQNTE